MKKAMVTARGGILGLVKAVPERLPPGWQVVELSPAQAAAVSAPGADRMFWDDEGLRTREEHRAAVLAARPVVVPPAVASWRLRVVLRRRGLAVTVRDALAALPPARRVVAEEAFAGADTLARGSLLVGALETALGMDGAAMDAVFVEAAALEV